MSRAHSVEPEATIIRKYDLRKAAPSSSDGRETIWLERRVVADVRLEHLPSTSSKDDFLGAGVEAKAEHYVEPMQPALGQRIVSKNCRGEQMVGGPNPSAEVMIGEDDTEDPQGDLHPGIRMRRTWEATIGMKAATNQLGRESASR